MQQTAEDKEARLADEEKRLQRAMSSGANRRATINFKTTPLGGTNVTASRPSDASPTLARNSSTTSTAASLTLASSASPQSQPAAPARVTSNNAINTPAPQAPVRSTSSAGLPASSSASTASSTPAVQRGQVSTEHNVSVRSDDDEEKRLEKEQERLLKVTTRKSGVFGAAFASAPKPSSSPSTPPAAASSPAASVKFADNLPTKTTSADLQKQQQKEKEQREAKEREQRQQQERAAQERAAQERAAQEKAAQERAAKERADQDLIRKKQELEQIERDLAAKKKELADIEARSSQAKAAPPALPQKPVIPPKPASMVSPRSNSNTPTTPAAQPHSASKPLPPPPQDPAASSMHLSSHQLHGPLPTPPAGSKPLPQPPSSSSSSSSALIGASVLAAIKSLASDEKARAAHVLRCNVKNGEVELQKSLLSSPSLKEIRDQIPDGAARLVVFRDVLVVDSKQTRALFVLLYYNPPETAQTQKMMYKNAKEQLLATIPGLKQWDVTSLDDIKVEVMKKSVLGKW